MQPSELVDLLAKSVQQGVAQERARVVAILRAAIEDVSGMRSHSFDAGDALREALEQVEAAP